MAYQCCLDSSRYSVTKPWMKLIGYAAEGEIQRSGSASGSIGMQTSALRCRCVLLSFTVHPLQGKRLIMRSLRLYLTQVARAFFDLGQILGHAKINFTLPSMGFPS